MNINSTTKKRVRTHFASSEIAHIWANQGAPTGHCPSSMSFDGDAFNSYNTTIARRIRSNGHVAYVVDRARFSVTTSNHQSAVLHALSDTDKVFKLDKGSYSQGLDYTPQSLRDYYLEQSKPQLTNHKLAHMRAREVIRQQTEREKALEVCEFFGLGTAKISALIEKHAPAVREAEDILDAKAKRQTELNETLIQRKKAAAIVRAGQIARGEREIEDNETFDRSYFGRRMWSAKPDEFLEERPDLQQAVDASRMRKAKVKIDAWRSGELSTYQLPNAYQLPAMLRQLDRETVETSRGARIPMSDAERAYRFVTSRRGQAWRSNGEQCPVGPYKLDAINEAGIVAGCHRISWDEIERFGKTCGW